MKDRSGKKVTAKEFMSRWKQGISEVTPLQQTKVNLIGYAIVFLGIIWGIIISAITRTWWLMVILIGSLIVSGSQFLAIIQKYLILKKLEVAYDESESETKIL